MYCSCGFVILCHLCYNECLMCFFFNYTATTEIYTDTLFPYTTLFRSDQRRIGFERLVRRKHVVVGVDDAQVGRGVGAQAALVGRAAGSEGVGEVAAAQAAAIRALLVRGFDAGQVGRADRTSTRLNYSH